MELPCCAETQPGTAPVGLPAVSYRLFTTRNIRFRAGASMSFSIGESVNRIRTANNSRGIGDLTDFTARETLKLSLAWQLSSVAYSIGELGNRRRLRNVMAHAT